jgi:hypothetical protein
VRGFFINNIFIENDLISRDFMSAVKNGMSSFAVFPDFVRGSGTKTIVFEAVAPLLPELQTERDHIDTCTQVTTLFAPTLI